MIDGSEGRRERSGGVARKSGLRFACLLLILAIVPAAAAGPTGGETERKVAVWEFLPDAGFYPLYIANPIRAQSSAMIVRVVNSDIPETGSARFSLRLGGQFPIVALHPHGDPEVGWQLDFVGGFAGQFDIDHHNDNIGWDGIFGLLLNYKPRPELAFRFGTLHDSAHVGDEYEARTGTRRIGYTREEVVLGVSWLASQRWRVYVEGGSEYGGESFQEPLRVEVGVEYRGRRLWRRARGSWYAAVDVGSYQENDWRPRVTGQVGIIIPTRRGGSRYRFALEAAAGRTALGEFYTAEETYVGLGWFFDF